MNSEKRDIYHNQERYSKWKEESKEIGISGLTKKNSDLIIAHLSDMEQGKNTGRNSRRGPRSFIRLNTIRTRLVPLIKLLQEKGIKDVEQTKADDIIDLFYNMRSGKIQKQNGGNYRSVADYEKQFSSFWSWLIRIRKKENIIIDNICEDLDKSKEENKFVYFTFEELQKMLPYFSQDEQVRMLFMFDTLARPPSEILNLKVSDIKFGEPDTIISIRVSKTYARTIKLLLCKEELKKYIERNNLKDEDFLFQFSPPIFNGKLKKVAKELFGDKITIGDKKYSELTMYDFRHSGACHWRTGSYKSKIDGLMYRGGWSNLNILNYYTKKIGMKDTIEKDDLLVNIDKHQLEKEMDKLKEVNEKLQKENELSKKKFKTFENQMKQMQELMMEATQKMRKI